MHEVLAWRGQSFGPLVAIYAHNAGLKLLDSVYVSLVEAEAQFMQPLRVESLDPRGAWQRATKSTANESIRVNRIEPVER